ASAQVAVRMQLFDPNNNVVFSLTCPDGDTVSTNFNLIQGTYKARFVAATRDGSPLPSTWYQLVGVSLSDPLDPLPTDPTDPNQPPPPTDPNLVVNSPPPNPT